MSISRNFGRTLSGQTDLTLDNIRLPAQVNTIKIDGNSGLPNQVLAKNGTTNKLEWDFVESTTIPDGSITGNKLAPNVTGSFNISTTGALSGAIITATDKFIQTGTNENAFNGQLKTPAITTLNSGDGVTTLNGGNIELFSDAGTTKKLEMDGSNGNITSSGLISGSSITTAGNITATGTVGFVGVGTDADSYKILLDKNGTITCDDINVLSHTGTITFNEIRTNQLEIPTTGVPDVFLSTNGVSTSAGTDISAGGKLSGQALLISDGTGTTSAIISGDVDATRLIKTTRTGATPPPTDNTYTEWGLDLNTANTHAHIGGNIICDGTIFGNVEGSITEEVVDCQRLNIRDGSVAGNIELNMNGNNINVGAGKIITADIGSSYLELDFSSTPEIDIGDGRSIPLVRLDKAGMLIHNENFISQIAVSVQDNGIQINNFGASNDKRILVDSTDGIQLFNGASVMNTQITTAGSIEYKTKNGLISGFFDASGTAYTDNTTVMKHMFIGSTNYKNHTYEIGVSIPNQSYREREFTTNSTAWSDLNDKLTVILHSDSSTSTSFIVDFSFYAVITAGSRLWLKLFDSTAKTTSNTDNPAYLNNTMSQVLLDTNGASDTAGVHNVRFFVSGLPANTTKTVQVASWVITSATHKVIFKSGGRVLGANSNNPSLTFNKYPPQYLQTHKLNDETNVSTSDPTGWTAPASSDDDY